MILEFIIFLLATVLQVNNLGHGPLFLYLLLVLNILVKMLLIIKYYSITQNSLLSNRKPEVVPVDYNVEMETAPINQRLGSQPQHAKLSMSCQPTMRKAHSTPELRGASSSKAMFK